MAAFRQHVTFSTILGAGYAAALKECGWDAGQALLAGGLCGLGGMLPDLDSDSGKPIKELFSLLATLASLFVFHRLRRVAWEPADRILAAAGCYLFVRFVISWLFARLTIHRGMWHSVPTACLVAELAFLGSDDVMGETGALALGGGVLLGFLSHLVLDELCSIHFKHGLPGLKHSSGTALKFFSESTWATLGTWVLLALVTYQLAVKMGYGSTWLPSAEQALPSVQAVLENWIGAKQ
jgi:hypothetical protein